mgnify:CR=1 FL=1
MRRDESRLKKTPDKFSNTSMPTAKYSEINTLERRIGYLNLLKLLFVKSIRMVKFFYIKTPLLALIGSGKSLSFNISRKSISIVLDNANIGISLPKPSKGFSE